MVKLATDPYEKAMRRHGFTEEFRQQVLESRRRERAARLRLQEISRARSIMCEHSVPKWVRELVIEIAARHDVSPGEVYSASRRRVVVAARQEAIYQTKATKPKTSSITIGKWFNRDHTTIFHSLAVYHRLHGGALLTKYDLDGQREQALNWYFANRSPNRPPLPATRICT